ncbi:4-hydroxythreonine-4-phosphate dehydrogenase PdxA, partial [Bacillus subtilis]|nr:4-hydroxythreonine-4-phosphate dehydrogenase PdxA [Bacillus subtilis]
MNTEPQSSRYSIGLAAEVLASEQSVLRLITRNTPLPELLVEVCRRAETWLGDGASCTILLLDTDGVHVRVGAAPSLPAQYSAAIDGALAGRYDAIVTAPLQNSTINDAGVPFTG